ncbi:MAG: response regulator [Candidatus Poribacteria bacterium]|nr:response regulator [Candidatus Poribacteria bacterium]
MILLDLKLPKLDGVDLLKRIRARESMRHVPVVMLSSSDLPSDIRRCYEAGANGYVVKPVNFDDLVTAMRQLCGFWLHLNRTFGASEA